MKITHNINPQLLVRVIDIVVVGAGGTGSALMPRLAQLNHILQALGHPGLSVRLYDGDTVAESNIGRQSFLQGDEDQYKASLTINRLNMTWGLNWQGYSCKINKSDRIRTDVIIGCVDTRKARAAIIGCIDCAHAYYIDAGNSKNSGQVVIGEIGGKRLMKDPNRLPTVADLFPEMVDVALDATDDQPSCSVKESIAKQSPVINQAMATEIYNLLWTLISTKTLKYSGRFVNLESGISTPIRMDTDAWARMGYEVKQKVRKSKKAA